jgi:hypothetical protein
MAAETIESRPPETRATAKGADDVMMRDALGQTAAKRKGRPKAALKGWR